MWIGLICHLKKGLPNTRSGDCLSGLIDYDQAFQRCLLVITVRSSSNAEVANIIRFTMWTLACLKSLLVLPFGFTMWLHPMNVSDQRQRAAALTRYTPELSLIS